MEAEQLVKLINSVSSSGLTEFQYEENGVKVQMKKETGRTVLSRDVQAAPPREGGGELPAGREAVEGFGGNVVKSPLVGTFYAAPSEGAEPFVRPGDAVKEGQTLAIVEAMKLMNEIESEFDGVVTEIFVKNGQTVEYGQPLFGIR